MIIEQKKLFFKTASIVLEDNKISELANSGKYSSIVALSYNKLDLPNFVSYSKPTLLIDLTQEESEIIKTFNDTTKNEIRKTFKLENLSFPVKENVSRESYEIYKKFERSQGRIPTSYKSLDQAISFEAVLNGEIISNIYVLECYPFLRIRSIFSQRNSTKDKNTYTLIGYATRRLVWDICLWGKKNGFTSLDLASVNINNPKTETISRFKMSFGRNLTPEYIYIYKTAMFSFIEKISSSRFIFKRLFSFTK